MKTKIVIASILKPVDDVRAYSKLSQSIAKTNKYEVNIIGNVGKKELVSSNVRFHVHDISRGNWLKRLWIREKILFKILSLKPHILIVSTHELLNIAWISKILLRCKVVYDVQENYYLNLKEIQGSFSTSLLATLVRLKETISKLFVDKYWLAEACYSNQLSFVKRDYLVLENKATKREFPERDFSSLRMLFSGTISEYGGIKKVIEIFEHSLQNAPNTTLTIIGQVHDKRLKAWLYEKQKKHSGLNLIVSKKSISHTQILDEIGKANLGIIGYKPTIVNKDKIPTKLYEYSRYRLPYLVEQNTKWSEVGMLLGAAIPADFNQLDIENLLQKMKKKDIYFPSPYPQEATWEYESKQMITSLKSLIKIT